MLFSGLKEVRLTPDNAILASCFLAEAPLIVILVKSRAFRAFPVFFLFVCWSFVSDLIFFRLQFLSLSPSNYLKFYEVQLIIDASMIFAVLVELAWSILRPIRASLPKNAWIGIAVFIAVIGLVLWPIAGLALPVNKLAPAGLVFFRLQQTFAILRVVVFLAMAGLSQLLSIGWRNRELQVATGLGFYSIVYLAVAILHTHQASGTQRYHWLDQFASASYFIVLAYWVFSFATKEAERRAFTPQMQTFLLAVAGSARSARISLADTPSNDRRDKGKK
ncbi:MAG: hypothetical protein ABR923_16120 [Terracidiphilus sp.]